MEVFGYVQVRKGQDEASGLGKQFCCWLKLYVLSEAVTYKMTKSHPTETSLCLSSRLPLLEMMDAVICAVVLLAGRL